MINRFVGDTRIGIGRIFERILFGMILNAVNGVLIGIFRFNGRNKGTEIQILIDGCHDKVLIQIWILLKLLWFDALMMIVHSNGIFGNTIVNIGWSI